MFFAVRCLQAILAKNQQRIWSLWTDGVTLGVGRDGLIITVGWLYSFLCGVLFIYFAYIFGVEAFVVCMVEDSRTSDGGASIQSSEEKVVHRAIQQNRNEDDDSGLQRPPTIFSTRRHITQARVNYSFNGRGICWTIYYCLLAGTLQVILDSVIGTSKLSQATIHISVTVLLAGLRMLSTQAMIAQSTSTITQRDWKALYFTLLVPVLVMAIAELASIQAMESSLSYAWDWKASYCESVLCAIGRQVIIWSALVASGSIIAFGWLLPLSMALARVEAALLPCGTHTVIRIPRFTQHTIDHVEFLQLIHLYWGILCTIGWTDVKRLAGSWIKIAVPLSALLVIALSD